MFLVNEVRKNLILNLNCSNRISGAMFGFSGDVGNFVHCPLDFSAHFMDEVNYFHAGHLFRFRRVHPDDLGMRMRTGQNGAVEHSGPFDIVCVLGGSGCLGDSVQSGDAFADQRSVLELGPFVISHCFPLSPERRQLFESPHKFRNGRDFHPSRL